MYSLSNRLNQYFFFMSMMILSGGGLSFLSAVYLQPHQAITSISGMPTKIILSQRFNWEMAQMEVQLQADLSSFDNWNLKHLFLFLQVDYNQGEKASEAIVWDKILPRDKLAKPLGLRIKNLKYPLRDLHNNLLGQNVTLLLKAEIMPLIGPMRYVVLDSTQVTMPSTYRQ